MAKATNNALAKLSCKPNANKPFELLNKKILVPHQRHSESKPRFP